MIEPIKHNDQTLASIFRGNSGAEGMQSFTPDEYSQQLGYMNLSTGHVILPPGALYERGSLHREVEGACDFLF